MKPVQQRLAAMFGAFVLVFLLLGTLVLGSIVYGAQQQGGALHITVGQSVLAAGTLRRWDCREHLLISADCPPVYGVWLSAPTPPLGRTSTTMLLEIPASVVVVFTGRPSLTIAIQSSILQTSAQKNGRDTDAPWRIEISPAEVLLSVWRGI